MRVEVELTDEMIITALQETAENQIWHINYGIQSAIKNGKIETFQLKDIRDCFKILEQTNKLIEYYGGEKAELRASKGEVKFGHDLDGNKFKD